MSQTVPGCSCCEAGEPLRDYLALEGWRRMCSRPGGWRLDARPCTICVGGAEKVKRLSCHVRVSRVAPLVGGAALREYLALERWRRMCSRPGGWRLDARPCTICVGGAGKVKRLSRHVRVSRVAPLVGGAALREYLAL